MKIVGIIIIAFSFILGSCSKNDDDSSGNPLGPGGGSQAASVSIDVSHLESTQYANVIEFYFKPSTLITLSKVDVAVGSFTDALAGDSQTQYQKDQWYMMVGYEGVEVGQQWTFTFYGKEVDANRDFNTTVTYVVNQ